MRILILSRVCASILSIAARTVLAPLKTGTTTSINGSLRAILSGQKVRSYVNDNLPVLKPDSVKKLGRSGPHSIDLRRSARMAWHDMPSNSSTSGLGPPGGHALTALTIDSREFNRPNRLHWHNDCNDHTPHLGRTRQDPRSSRPDGGRQHPRRPTRSRRPAAKQRTAEREFLVAREMCGAVRQGKIRSGFSRDRGVVRLPIEIGAVHLNSPSMSLIRRNNRYGKSSNGKKL